MIPYSEISSVIIKPYHLFCYTEGNRRNEIKKIFLACFEDNYALIFLRHLIIYCDQKNNGERWPDKITPEIVSWISKKSNIPINIERMKIFEDGYLIKEKDGDNFELTHEFIVASFMCCSESGSLPLNNNHIDCDKTEEFVTFLKKKIKGVEENVLKADPCVRYVKQHKLKIVDGVDIITCSELMLIAYYMIPTLSKKNQKAT
jgi:hypothetical protein